jgi:hypothetical protein
VTSEIVSRLHNILLDIVTYLMISGDMGSITHCNNLRYKYAMPLLTHLTSHRHRIYIWRMTYFEQLETIFFLPRCLFSVSDCCWRFFAFSAPRLGRLSNRRRRRCPQIFYTSGRFLEEMYGKSQNIVFFLT